MAKPENNELTPETIDTEIENRIRMMERDDYVFPERIKKADWVGFLVLILLCLLGVVALILYCK